MFMICVIFALWDDTQYPCIDNLLINKYNYEVWNILAYGYQMLSNDICAVDMHI